MHKLIFCLFFAASIFLWVQSNSLFNFIEINKSKFESFFKSNKSCPARSYMKTFLIENMKWHKTNYLYDDITENHNRLLSYIKKLDSYDISSSTINDINSLSDSLFIQPRANIDDEKYFSSTKLDKYVEYKYKQWRKHKDISLDSFCRYNLPYRPTLIDESGIIDSSIVNEIGLLFNSPQMSLKDIIFKLNKKIAKYKNITYFAQGSVNLGILKILWINNIGCFAAADYTALILRMNNIEATSEFCLGFKHMCGKHAYCVALDTIDVKFNPSSMDYISDNEINEMLNIYRINYFYNPSSPYFIDTNWLDIPKELAHPCIEDVSRLRHKNVQEITIKFNQPLTNNIVYLACFDSREKTKYTTWGVNVSDQSVVFKNIIPVLIYYPIHINKGEIKIISEPFYIDYNEDINKPEVIPIINPDTSRVRDIVITRKYPIKESVLKRAQKMIGSVFIASNDGQNWDTLHIITDTPKIGLQRMNLKNTKPYKIYKYKAKNGEQINISHIEYLTLKKYKYSNTTMCSNLSNSLLSNLEREGVYERLINGPSEIFLSETENNDNVEVSPSWKNEISLLLETPQIINDIIFTPSNANNGIVPFNLYTLYYWHNKWISVETKMATSHYIEFKDIPENALLWLKNETTGTEEMLFMVKNDIQYFVNHKDFPALLKQ